MFELCCRCWSWRFCWPDRHNDRRDDVDEDAWDKTGEYHNHHPDEAEHRRIHGEVFCNSAADASDDFVRGTSVQLFGEIHMPLNLSRWDDFYHSSVRIELNAVAFVQIV